MSAFAERGLQCATHRIGESAAGAQTDHASAGFDVPRQHLVEIFTCWQRFHRGIAPGHVDDRLRHAIANQYQVRLVEQPQRAQRKQPRVCLLYTSRCV